MIRARIDLHRCIGAGTCIFLAPTAFRWRRVGPKVEVLDAQSIAPEVLREVALACPTQAIILDDDLPLAPLSGIAEAPTSATGENETAVSES